jgi:L-lactate dehydrogenase complex protein LldE
MTNYSNKISLFVPCMVDQFRPSVARASEHVLELIGKSYHVAGPGLCCGQPAFNQGFREEARRVARKWIERHESYGAVVSPSGSCVNMVRNHYIKLFEGDPEWRERAAAVAERTFEIFQYLVDVERIVDFGASFPHRVTYHDSCHVNRRLGIKTQPRAILGAVKGLTLVEMEASDVCCGFGGLFSYTHAPISHAIVDTKVRNIMNANVDAAVTAETGCLLNIEAALKKAGAPVGVYHLIEVIEGVTVG